MFYFQSRSQANSQHHFHQPQSGFYPQHQHQVFLPPYPFQQQVPLHQHHQNIPQHFPTWHHHPDIPYKSPEQRVRSRTSSGKKRPSFRNSGGGTGAVSDVECSGGGGGRVVRRSRSRAGSVSFPANTELMSPSVEKNFRLHHQVTSWIRD